MNGFKPMHVQRSHSHELDAAPEAVFPLLCPVREYEWIDFWDCELVRSVSGVAERDCVFTTDLPTRGPETWLVYEYMPGERIGFVVNGPGRVVRYWISLAPLDGVRCRITYDQVLTGLDARGNEYLATLTPEVYALFMGALSKILNHYLTTGERMPMEQALHPQA